MGFFFNDKVRTPFIQFNSESLTFPLAYQVLQKSQFVLNDATISQTEMEALCTIESIEQIDNGFFIRLKTEDKHMLKCNEQYRPLAKFATLLNLPLETLIIKLDSNGVPREVVNQIEVNEKWEYIRDNMILKQWNDEGVKSIVSGANKDFSNVIELINNSMLYIAFFPCVYGPERTLRKFDITSQLFKDTKVEFNLKERILWSSNVVKCFEHYSEGNYSGTLRKQYEQTFDRLSNKPFNPQFQYTSKYSYTTQTGTLESCQTRLYEQAANGIYTQQEISIQLISENE